MQGYELDKMDVFFSLQVHHYNGILFSNPLFSSLSQKILLFVGKSNSQLNFSKCKRQTQAFSILQYA